MEQSVRAIVVIRSILIIECSFRFVFLFFIEGIVILDCSVILIFLFVHSHPGDWCIDQDDLAAIKTDVRVVDSVENFHSRWMRYIDLHETELNY